MENRKTLNTRKFVTYTVSIFIVILLFSGLVLYVAPKCRVANWINWRVAGLSKHSWEAVHTIFAFLFFTLVSIHLYLNWNIFIRYIRSKLDKNFRLSREFLFAISLTALIFFATLLNIPPFNWIINFGERMKFSWELQDNQPLYHKDKLPNIRKGGKRFGRISPEHHIKRGYGYGRKRIVDVCKELNIPVERALARLSRRGIYAYKDIPLKSISREYYISPVQAVDIIRGR